MSAAVNRLRAAWYLLRGKPVMSGVTMYLEYESAVWIPEPENLGLLVTSCNFVALEEADAEAEAPGLIFGPTRDITPWKRLGVNPREHNGWRLRKLPNHKPGKGWTER